MVGIQPTTPFGDVVAGVAVVHSAFAVEVLTAVAEGGMVAMPAVLSVTVHLL